MTLCTNILIPQSYCRIRIGHRGRQASPSLAGVEEQLRRQLRQLCSCAAQLGLKKGYPQTQWIFPTPGLISSEYNGDFPTQLASEYNGDFPTQMAGAIDHF